ncbi:KWG Leptospira repeat protein, partial [human gut metagenome]
AGYEYQFDYDLAKALTDGGFKLVNSNGTYAINDVVNQYSTINENLILGKKGDYWYLYNKTNGFLLYRLSSEYPSVPCPSPVVAINYDS